MPIRCSRNPDRRLGVNIPGKRRQLLNYPMSDAYLDRLRTVAASAMTASC